MWRAVLKSGDSGLIIGGFELCLRVLGLCSFLGRRRSEKHTEGCVFCSECCQGDYYLKTANKGMSHYYMQCQLGLLPLSGGSSEWKRQS